MEKELKVIGSLNPDKECQDRVRVMARGGLNPALRATDYKDPTKVVKKWKSEQSLSEK